MALNDDELEDLIGVDPLDNDARDGGFSPGQKLQEEEEEEDYVVEEMEVFMSQSLNRSLYVLQYPLRPNWRPYDLSSLSSVKLKPQQKRLRMEFELPVHNSPHFDPSNQLCVPQFVDGSNHKHFVLESYPAPSITPLAVGVFRAGGLYLTPILQTGAPSIDNSSSSSSSSSTHLDQVEEQPTEVVDDIDPFGMLVQRTRPVGPAKTPSTATPAPAAPKQDLTYSSAILQMKPDFSHLPCEDLPDVEAVQAKTPAKPAADDGLQFRFKKKESERAKAARERSFLWISREREMEEWMDLKFHPNPELQHRFWDDLMLPLDCDQGPDFSMDRTEYLNLLASPPFIYEDPAPKAAGVSSDGLNAASQPSQPSYKPLPDQPLSLYRLAEFPIRKKLQFVMAKARTFPFSNLLLLFPECTERELVSHLSDFSLLVNGRWVILGQYLFEDELHIRAWNYLLHCFSTSDYLRRQQFDDVCLLGPKVSFSFLSSIADHIVGSGWCLKIPALSHHFLAVHQSTVADHAHKLARFGDLFKTEDLAALPSPAASPAQHRPVGQKQASEHHFASIGQAPSSSSSSLPFQARLQAHILQLLTFTLIKNGLGSREALYRWFLHFQSNPLPGFEPSFLSAPVPEALFVQVLQESCIELQPNIWILPKSQDPSLDPYRNVVIQLFRLRNTLQKKEIVDSWRSAINQVASPNSYNSIMKEFANGRKNGSWVLKDPQILPE